MHALVTRQSKIIDWFKIIALKLQAVMSNNNTRLSLCFSLIFHKVPCIRGNIKANRLFACIFYGSLWGLACETRFTQAHYNLLVASWTLIIKGNPRPSSLSTAKHSTIRLYKWEKSCNVIYRLTTKIMYWNKYYQEYIRSRPYVLLVLCTNTKKDTQSLTFPICMHI